MRIRLFLCVVAAGMLAGVTAASAGSLTSATWIQGINTSGIVSNIPVSVNASGTATNAGAYAATISIPNAVNLVSTTIPTPTAPVSLGVIVSVGPGVQKINTGVATKGMPGQAEILLGGLVGVPLVTAPISAGVNAFTSFTPLMGIHVSVTGFAWTTGTIKITGLTNSPVVGGSGTRTFAGTNSLTPGGGGSVTLVSPSKVTIVGGSPGTTASFAQLTLHYAGAPVPEPGTLLLLGAGIVGLVAVGRGKKRS